LARTDHAAAAPPADARVNEHSEFTGERFLPGAPGEIWYEHWHRYHFAAKLVSGKRVLDVACGAGYGSALLAQHGAEVVGADIAAEAIAHARARYADVPRLEFIAADCAALPFPDSSFDAVVSFETIEHIRNQEAFLDEVRRVLRADGLFVLSSPNKLEYSDRRGFSNEFHIRELYRDELSALLAPRFPHARWFGQRTSFFSIVWPEDTATAGDVFEVSESSAAQCSSGHARPLYFIVVATNSAEAFASVVPRLSVLADQDEWVYADYMKAFEHEKIQWERSNALDGVVAEWQGHFREATKQRDALEKTVIDLSAQAGREAAEHAAERARLAQQIDTQQHEIERRASVRWWLALPWRRLRNALRHAPPPA
jgi:2-polyprenyl-3-methyl-5-hydroxy-6-metoxy-1,4-benzoquinol methylase